MVVALFLPIDKIINFAKIYKSLFQILARNMTDTTKDAARVTGVNDLANVAEEVSVDPPERKCPFDTSGHRQRSR